MPEAQSFLVKGQYIKDLSFESPNSPGSLMPLTEPPKIDVNVSLRAQKLHEDFYELVMQLAAKATTQQDQGLFLADLSYAGVFQLVNVPPEQAEALLLVDCAFILFPFARRVMSDITRDGGFLPLMLDPIDFAALYIQNRQQAKKTAGA